VSKNDNGTITYYLRSTVLSGAVVSEFNYAGGWMRGYVYQGGGLLAILTNGTIYWNHEDPVTKSKRITDSAGNVYSAVESDPWGADTARSSNQYFQPHRSTSYERDGNGSDEAMFRRYNRWHSRFDQPDPTDESYDTTDPQSLNRYAYVKGDPVNFVDPSGLVPCLNVETGKWEDCPGSPPRIVINTNDHLSDLLFVLNSRFNGFTSIPQNREPGNPNCITNAVKDSTLAKRPSNNIEGNPKTGGNIHDGPHVVPPTEGKKTPVTALPAMAGRVAHAGRQGGVGNDGYPYSIVYIPVKGKGGEQLMLGLVDMFFDTGLNRNGQPVVAGQTIGYIQNNGNEGGLHVNLMSMSTYQKYIVKGDGGKHTPFSYKARQAVPVNLLIDAARDPRSPFKCP
jgi:RHS repeat-associated protein